MKVIIERYNPDWVDKFGQARKELARCLSEFHPSIEHIGSTAVPGLGAKPKIDILVGLSDASQLDRVVAPMQSIGYTYFKVYEASMPYRRLMVKLLSLHEERIPNMIDEGEFYVDGEQFRSLVHVHAMEFGSEHWTRHIAFRDYLRSNDDVRDQYYDLKKKLSEVEVRDGNEYNKLKNEFIQEIQAKAVEWFKRR
ncbi:MAG: GrpB family protein [Cyclobacteriaceae bacterium]